MTDNEFNNSDGDQNVAQGDGAIGKQENVTQELRGDGNISSGTGNVTVNQGLRVKPRIVLLAVVLLAGIGGGAYSLFAPPPDHSVHQTHSGTGDTVGGDKNVTNDNSVQQSHIVATNVAGRDQIIHQHLLGSVDYQELVQEIKDAQELLAGIAPEKTALHLK